MYTTHPGTRRSADPMNPHAAKATSPKPTAGTGRNAADAYLSPATASACPPCCTTQRGMTREALARHAKVSGAATSPSSRPGSATAGSFFLRRISRAVGLPVTQTGARGLRGPRSNACCSPNSSSASRRQRSAEAHDLLLRHFSEPSDDAHHHGVALISLRGSSKCDGSASSPGPNALACPSSSSTARSRSAAAPP